MNISAWVQKPEEMLDNNALPRLTWRNLFEVESVKFSDDETILQAYETPPYGAACSVARLIVRGIEAATRLSEISKN